MRDPSGDCNKVKTKLWTSPTTKKERIFDQCVSHSWFKLSPSVPLASKTEEDSFIERTCHEVGNSIARVMQSEAFAECYKAAVANDNVWAAISKEHSGYASFVKRARVVVGRCDNFNKHLTKNDACVLSEILYNNNGPSKKCSEDEFVDASPS